MLAIYLVNEYLHAGVFDRAAFHFTGEQLQDAFSSSEILTAREGNSQACK